MDQSQWQILQQMLAMRQPGMQGTQSGPVQESPLMRRERVEQGLSSAGWGTLGGLLGYGGVATGNLPAALAGSGIAMTGIAGLQNAFEPNIRDVEWDKRRMRAQQGR